ncbi:hypothetical protein HanIR_Chr09g0442571 [Helianthus annuus]|nr:hypothetical protein HanIR_Chr09g0442571 [Helianthus annuus]
MGCGAWVGAADWVQRRLLHPGLALWSVLPAWGGNVAWRGALAWGDVAGHGWLVFDDRLASRWPTAI